MEYFESLIIDRTKTSIRLRSPAKINLYLRVLDERPDGYHNLENLMQTISFCDEIEIQLTSSGDITVECTDPDVPEDDENIAAKAAKRFFEKTRLENGTSAGIRTGARINIVKRIPMGSGLGGGSSNAGTVLLGLNELFDCPLDRDSLQEIATGLGSDVPFFLFGGLALCLGKGDIVKSIEPSEQYWIVLVNPCIFVSTGKIYEVYKKKCLTLKQKSVNLLQCDSLKRVGDIVSLLHNDLEATVQKEYSELKAIKKDFRLSECNNVMVTGSGSTVFGLCESRAHAARVCFGLRKLLIDRKFLIVEASNLP